MNTTQLKMINFDVEKILKKHIDEFYPPSEAIPAKIAITKCLLTGQSVWHLHCIKSTAFLWLIDKINENLVAIHECFDDYYNRANLKKRLWIGSGNFHREIYRKETG